MDGEYVNMTEAAERLGMSYPAFRRRVESGDVATFTNPRDRRGRLVLVRDLDAFATPKPAAPRRGHEGGIGTEPRPPQHKAATLSDGVCRTTQGRRP